MAQEKCAENASLRVLRGSPNGAIGLDGSPCRERNAEGTRGVGAEPFGEGLVRETSRIPGSMTLERPLLAPSGAAFAPREPSTESANAGAAR